MARFVLLVFALVLLSNCKEEEVFTPVFEIPSETRTYVESFFALASERSMKLDTSNLIIRFSSDLNADDGTPICGNAEGSLTGDLQHVVVLDPECLAWRHSESSREILIFHELAHVFLERVHDNELLPNGDYRSIMFGGSWNVLRYYTEDATKKPYYLEELFDPSTPIPDWSK